jgi:hypothetical protein
MSEAWVMELLSGARDMARSKGLFRLAEHMDDAMLIAASEFHESTLAVAEPEAHDCESADTLRGAACAWVH